MPPDDRPPHTTVPLRSPGRSARIRWRYPARTLHLVDIENLAGVPVPSLEHVRALEPRYAERFGYGTLDQSCWQLPAASAC